MTPLLWYLLMVLPATCLYIYGLISSKEVREFSFIAIVITLFLAFIMMTIFGIAGIIAVAMGQRL